MISTKMTTQNWTKAEQESSIKADPKNYLSAKDQTKLPSGKDIGTVLNEVADPNWVDPKKLRKVGNNQLDKDAFFKLMLAQVKNQDPSNPMKTDEMAANIAQFTGLEQMMNLNEKVDGLAKIMQPSSNFQALNFIGRSVSGDSSKIMREIGDKNHDLRFRLQRDTVKAAVNIKDAAGETVRTYEIGDLKMGDQKISWNGLDKNGKPARAGQYYFEVNALGKSGEKVAVQTGFRGRITGVNYTAEGPVVMIGDQQMRISDIQKIEDETLKETQKASEADVTHKTVAPVAEEDVQGAPPPKPTGNLENVAMSSGLKDALSGGQ